MATLRYAAQSVLGEARDGIAWIVLWKEGRGWETSRFYLEFDERKGTVTLDWPDELETLQNILAIDPQAIIVNSYVHNLSVFEGYVSREDLASALRWQYELQNATLADFMDRIVQPAQEPADHAAQIAPNDLDEMHKNENHAEDGELAAGDHQERPGTQSMDELTVYKVWATWTDRRGNPFTRSVRMFATDTEALEWYTALRDSFKGAQSGGMVKHFTMHLEEQHLEPGKEA